MGFFSRSKKKDKEIVEDNPLRGRPPPPRPNAPPPPGSNITTGPPPRPPPGGISDNASLASSSSSKRISGRPPPPRPGPPRPGPPPRPGMPPGRGPPPRPISTETLQELQESKKKITELMADNVDIKKKLVESNDKLALYEQSGETSRSALLEKEVALLHTDLQSARLERMTLHTSLLSMQEEMIRTRAHGLSETALKAMSSLLGTGNSNSSYNNDSIVGSISDNIITHTTDALNDNNDVLFEQGDNISEVLASNDDDNNSNNKNLKKKTSSRHPPPTSPPRKEKRSSSGSSSSNNNDNIDDEKTFFNDTTTGGNSGRTSNTTNDLIKSSSAPTPTINSSSHSVNNIESGLEKLALHTAQSAREADLIDQLLKEKRDKEKAVKLLITLIGKDRVREHLRLHGSSSDILESLVTAFSLGGNMYHLRGESKRAASK